MMLRCGTTQHATTSLGRPARLRTTALDPDEKRVRHAPLRLMIDSEWLKLRVGKALELLVRRLESAPTELFRPVLPHLRRPDADLPDHRCHEAPVPPDRWWPGQGGPWWAF
jgi:hypothetical protein